MSQTSPQYYNSSSAGQIPIISPDQYYNQTYPTITTTTQSKQTTKADIPEKSTTYVTDDEGTQRIFLIVIVALILIVGIIILILYLTSDNNNIEREQGDICNLPFGAACDVDHKCAAGLVCETTCKKGIGQSCTSLSDCVSTATTCTINSSGQNVCKTGPVGGLDENCPCDSGLLCNTDGLCKRQVGSSCTADSDCITNQCNDGVCGHGSGLGEQCQTTADCDLELQCSNGICQEDGVETGEQGSYCNSTCQCNGNLTCIDNRCAVTTQGLGDPCGNGLLCSPELICSSTSTRRCYDGICVYPENNSCSCRIACPLDSKCVCGKCLGLANAPCSLSSQCACSTCNTSQGSLYTWNGNGWTLFSLLPQTPMKIDIIPGNGTSTLDTVWMISEGGVWWYDRTNISGATWILAYENTIDWETTGRVYVQWISTYDNQILVSGRIRAADLTVYTAMFSTTMNIDGTINLTEFNTTNPLRPGQQYSTTNYPLVIQTFSANPNLDIAIVAPDENNNNISSVFTKSDAVTNYELIQTSINSPISQYIPNTANNVAVVSSDMTKVEFLGSLSGVKWPTDSDHIIVDQDIDDYQTGRIIILAKQTYNSYYSVFIIEGGVQLSLPGWFGPNSRVAVSPSSYFISSVGRCG